MAEVQPPPEDRLPDRGESGHAPPAPAGGGWLDLVGELAGIIAWELDVPSDRLRCAQGLESLLGIAPGTFAGTLPAFLGFVHRDDRERIRDLLAASISVPQQHAGAWFRIVRPDGSIIHVEFRSRCIATRTDGGAQSLRGIIRDISDEVRVRNRVRGVAEAVGRISGAEAIPVLVRSLAEQTGADHALAAVFETGERSRQARSVASWSLGRPGSPFAFDIIGTPAECLVGGGTCSHGSGIQAIFPQDPLLKRLGAEGCVAVPLSDASGHTIGLLALIFRRPISEDADELVELLGIFASRTAAELERAEMAADREDLAAQLQLLIEHAPEAVCILDTDLGRILVGNGNACRLFGRNRDELLATPFAELSPERQPDGSASRQRFHDHAAEALAGATPCLAWTLQRADHAAIPCEVRLVRLPHRTRRLLRVSIIDLSDRQRAEERLRQAEKMDALGQLAGGVAHDFNNMLAGIMGAAELLGTRLGQDSPHHRLVRTIIQSADRAADLTRKLLSFSRKAPLSRRPIDLRSVVEEALALLERSIDRSISLRRDLGSEALVVEGDAAHLQNMVLNLGINARDAMPRGGSLSIAIVPLSIDSRFAAEGAVQVKPGRYAELTISDTGLGMDAATMRRIFEPFFTTKPLNRGTGLGLAAVYGTVQEHHGTIRVYSEPGQGTVFKIYLPLSQESPAETTSSTFRVTAPGGRVLLIDDEDLVRTAAGELLAALGWCVVHARDGQEGVDRLATDPQDVDLAIVDSVMPRLDGRGCFEGLRRIRPDLPVVFCSGFSRDRSIGELADLPRVAFVQKPFRLAELARAIQLVRQD